MLMDVIVDIDGTLSDPSHRLHWVRNKPKNWDAFFSTMHLDLPNWDIINLARAMHDAGHRIVITTGREEIYREVTRLWLQDVAGLHDVYRGLYMRPKKDYRADYIVKEELLGVIRADGFDPTMAIDDRKQVVDMWRRNGLRALAVAEGEF